MFKKHGLSKKKSIFGITFLWVALLAIFIMTCGNSLFAAGTFNRDYGSLHAEASFGSEGDVSADSSGNISVTVNAEQATGSKSSGGCGGGTTTTYYYNEQNVKLTITNQSAYKGKITYSVNQTKGNGYSATHNSGTIIGAGETVTITFKSGSLAESNALESANASAYIGSYTVSNISFELIPVNVSVSSNNTSFGSTKIVDANGNSISSVTPGTALTATATPNNGYIFLRWENVATGETVSEDSTYSFQAVSDISLRAVFEEVPTSYSVSSTVAPSSDRGTVRITIDGTAHDITSGSFEASIGSTVTLQAIPANGYRFVGWVRGITEDLVDFLDAYQNKEVIFESLIEIPADNMRNVEYTAVFCRLNTYSVSVNDSTIGSATVAVGDSVPSETSVKGVILQKITYTAIENNSAFEGWYENGLLVSTENVYSFSVDSEEDRTLEARFRNPIVTILSGVGVESVKIVDSDGNEIALNKNSASVVKGTQITVTAVIKSGYSFYCWNNDKSLTANPYTFTVEDDVTYTAFCKDSSGNIAGECKNLNTGVIYATLKEGLDAAASGNTIVLIAPSVLSEDATVKSGVTLLVPYGEEKNSNYETTTEYVSIGNPCRNYLTVNKGAKLTVNGTMVVNAKQGSYELLTGSVIGDYGLVMLFGEIYVTGTLDVRGIIKGDGKVTTSSSAVIDQFISIPDWKGGSYSSDIYKTAFPVNNFAIQNIQTETHYVHGATLNARYYFYMSNKEFTGTVKLIGSASSGVLFQTTSGSEIVFGYEASKAKTVVDIYGKIYARSLKISLSAFMMTVEMDTSKTQCPLPGSFSVNIKDGGEFEITSNFKILPGCVLTVEEGGTLTIPSTGKLYLYDVDDFDREERGTQGYPYRRFPTTAGYGSYYTYQETEDGELIVDGTVNIQGYLYCSSASGNMSSSIKTTKNTGKIIIGKKAGTATVNETNASLSGTTSIGFSSARGLMVGGTTWDEFNVGTYYSNGEAWYLSKITYMYGGKLLAEDYTVSTSHTHDFSDMFISLDSASKTSGTGNVSHSGTKVSFTGLSGDITVAIQGTKKEVNAYFLLSEQQYKLYVKFTSKSITETIQVNGNTYYVVKSGQMYAGDSYSAPSDPDMGVTAANHNIISWNVQDSKTSMSYNGTISYISQKHDNYSDTFIFGFYTVYSEYVSVTGKYYFSFYEAMSALPNYPYEGYIQVFGDDDENSDKKAASFTIPAGSELYIDLRGNKVYGSINNEGELTITDSVGGGCIESSRYYASNTIANYAGIVRNHGTLTISGKGITFIMTQDAGITADKDNRNAYATGLLNYNGGYITKIENLTIRMYMGYGIYNYGGTIDLISGLTITGLDDDTPATYGIYNRNVRSGDGKTPETRYVVDHVAHIGKIIDINIFAGDIGIFNSAIIDEISGTGVIKVQHATAAAYHPCISNRNDWYSVSATQDTGHKVYDKTTTKSNGDKVVETVYDLDNVPTIGKISGNLRLETSSQSAIYNGAKIGVISGDVSGNGMTVRAGNSYALNNAGFIDEISGKITFEAASQAILNANTAIPYFKTVETLYNDQATGYSNTSVAYSTYTVVKNYQTSIGSIKGSLAGGEKGIKIKTTTGDYGIRNYGVIGDIENIEMNIATSYGIRNEGTSAISESQTFVIDGTKVGAQYIPIYQPGDEDKLDLLAPKDTKTWYYGCQIGNISNVDITVLNAYGISNAGRIGDISDVKFTATAASATNADTYGFINHDLTAGYVHNQKFYCGVNPLDETRYLTLTFNYDFKKVWDDGAVGAVAGNITNLEINGNRRYGFYNAGSVGAIKNLTIQGTEENVGPATYSFHNTVYTKYSLNIYFHSDTAPLNANGTAYINNTQIEYEKLQGYVKSIDNAYIGCSTDYPFVNTGSVIGDIKDLTINATTIATGAVHNIYVAVSRKQNYKEGEKLYDRIIQKSDGTGYVFFLKDYSDHTKSGHIGKLVNLNITVETAKANCAGIYNVGYIESISGNSSISINGGNATSYGIHNYSDEKNNSVVHYVAYDVTDKLDRIDGDTNYYTVLEKYYIFDECATIGSIDGLTIYSATGEGIRNYGEIPSITNSSVTAFQNALYNVANGYYKLSDGSDDSAARKTFILYKAVYRNGLVTSHIAETAYEYEKELSRVGIIDTVDLETIGTYTNTNIHGANAVYNLGHIDSISNSSLISATYNAVNNQISTTAYRHEQIFASGESYLNDIFPKSDGLNYGFREMDCINYYPAGYIGEITSTEMVVKKATANNGVIYNNGYIGSIGNGSSVSILDGTATSPVIYNAGNTQTSMRMVIRSADGIVKKKDGDVRFLWFYDRYYTYEVPATIGSIEGITVVNTLGEGIRNYGVINTLTNVDITCAKNGIYNYGQGHYKADESGETYSRKSTALFWENVKFATNAPPNQYLVAETNEYYEYDLSTIGKIENVNITTTTSGYGLYNAGQIDSIKDSSFTSATNNAIYNFVGTEIIKHEPIYSKGESFDNRFFLKSDESGYICRELEYMNSYPCGYIGEISATEIVALNVSTANTAVLYNTGYIGSIGNGSSVNALDGAATSAVIINAAATPSTLRFVARSVDDTIDKKEGDARYFWGYDRYYTYGELSSTIGSIDGFTMVNEKGEGIRNYGVINSLTNLDITCAKNGIYNNGQGHYKLDDGSGNTVSRTTIQLLAETVKYSPASGAGAIASLVSETSVTYDYDLSTIGTIENVNVTTTTSGNGLYNAGHIDGIRSSSFESATNYALYNIVSTEKIKHEQVYADGETVDSRLSLNAAQTGYVFRELGFIDYYPCAYIGEIVDTSIVSNNVAANTGCLYNTGYIGSISGESEIRVNGGVTTGVALYMPRSNPSSLHTVIKDITNELTSSGLGTPAANTYYTQYDRYYRYDAHPYIGSIDGISIISEAGEGIRNSGEIESITGTTIQANNSALYNMRDGYYINGVESEDGLIARKTLQVYTGTTQYAATTSYIAASEIEYSLALSKVGTIENSTLEATAGQYGIRNNGRIDSITNCDISAKTNYAIDNGLNTTDVNTSPVVYYKMTYDNGLTSTYGIAPQIVWNGSKYVIATGYTATNSSLTQRAQASIGLIGSGNTIHAEGYYALANRGGLIEQIGDINGAPTTIISDSTANYAALYNYSGTNIITTVTEGTTVQETVGAQIGSIENTSITGYYRALQNGDASNYLDVIGEIKEGTVVLSKNNDALYNATKNAEIRLISGGEFKSEKASTDKAKIYALNNANTSFVIPITGGVFGCADNLIPNLINTSGNEISGGYFCIDVTPYIIEGYECAYLDNGEYRGYYYVGKHVHRNVSILEDGTIHCNDCDQDCGNVAPVDPDSGSDVINPNKNFYYYVGNNGNNENLLGNSLVLWKNSDTDMEIANYKNVIMISNPAVDFDYFFAKVQMSDGRVIIVEKVGFIHKESGVEGEYCIPIVSDGEIESFEFLRDAAHDAVVKSKAQQVKEDGTSVRFLASINSELLKLKMQNGKLSSDFVNSIRYSMTIDYANKNGEERQISSGASTQNMLYTNFTQDNINITFEDSYFFTFWTNLATFRNNTISKDGKNIIRVHLNLCALDADGNIVGDAYEYVYEVRFVENAEGQMVIYTSGDDNEIGISLISTSKIEDATLLSKLKG